MESKPPKIALCLSGLIRNSFFCFPYIYHNFLNQGLDVDVFIHTWNESSAIQLYNPKKYQIENQKDTLKFILPQINLDWGVKIEGRVENNVSMFYSIKRCTDLVDSEYDIIVRCRFDLLLQEDIKFKNIVQDILDKKYDIYIPNTEFNMGGYNDQLAIGSYSSMKLYSDCYFSLVEISNKIKRWHPETFLKEYLDKFHIKIYQDAYDYRIVRNIVPVLHWPQNPYNYKNI